MSIESQKNSDLEEERKSNLNSLANKYLDLDGQIDVQLYIEDGELDSAATYLLGVIDALWNSGRLPEDEARDAYSKLGFDSDKAARIRSSSKHISSFWKKDK